MIEKEYKVLLSEEQYRNISNYFKWQKTFTQVNTYYEDEEHYISDNNITIRIREKNGEYFLQSKIKIGIPTQNALHLKREEEIIVEKVFDIIPSEMINRLIGLSINNVYRVGELSTFRKKNTECTGVELCLDKNDYLGTTDYELEIEYIDDIHINAVLDFFINQFNLDFSKKSEGKNTRFMNRLRDNNGNI